MKPNCGVYAQIYTWLKETPLNIYIRKKFENSNLLVYYSKLNKHPDFEVNQGCSSESKICIANGNDQYFTTEYLYLSMFSETGCQFEVVCSFKNEIPLKTFGGSTTVVRRLKKKEKPKEIITKDPLDFLYEEVDEAEMAERKKNYHEYYKTVIDAIIADKRAFRDFMKKIKGIKEKRFKEASGKNKELQSSLINKSPIGINTIYTGLFD